MSVHAFVSGHLGYLHSGTIMNGSYTRCSYTKHGFSFLLYFPKRWIAGSYGSCLEETAEQFSRDWRILHSTGHESWDFLLFFFLESLEEVIQRPWPLADPQAEARHSEAPHLPPALAIYLPPTRPTAESIFKGSPASGGHWDQLGAILDCPAKAPI